jgi:hypothetical protein
VLDGARQDHAEAERRLDTAAVDLDFDLTSERLAAFQQLTEAFRRLASAASVWDTIAKADNDQRVTRSSAQQTATLERVKFAVEDVPPGVRSSSLALRFGNANGADLRMLPLVVFAGQPDGAFAVIDLCDLSVEFEEVSVLERGVVPADANVIDETWERVNKDGTPDRRFRDNRKYPVVAYGQLTITSPTGVHEVYMISSSDAARGFAEAFASYKKGFPAVGPA